MGQESSQLVQEEEEPLQTGTKRDPFEPSESSELIENAEERPEKLEKSTGSEWELADTNHAVNRAMDSHEFHDSVPKRQKKSKKRKRNEAAQDQYFIEELEFNSEAASRFDPTNTVILEESAKKPSRNRKLKKETRLAQAIEQDAEEGLSFRGEPEDPQNPDYDADATVDAYPEAAPAKKKKLKKRRLSFEQAGIVPNAVRTFGNENMSSYGESPQLVEDDLVWKDANMRSKKKKKKARPSTSLGEINDPTQAYTPPGDEAQLVSPTRSSSTHIRFGDTDLATLASSEPFEQLSTVDSRSITAKATQKPRQSGKGQSTRSVEIVQDASNVENQNQGEVTDALNFSSIAEPETDKCHTSLNSSLVGSSSLAPVDLSTNRAKPSVDSRSPSPVIAGPSTRKTLSADDANSDSEGDHAVTKIGVYLDSAVLPIHRPRKRRLPVEDDDSPATKESRKKESRKSKSLLPKAQMTPGQPLKWQPPTKRRSTAKKRITRKTSSSKEGNQETNLTGKMTEEELTIMANEMEKFRDLYNMTVFDQNQLVAGGETKLSAELWDTLCAALPGRNRLSVRRVCRRRFHNYGARGKFTPEEDELLKELYEKYPKSWKKIGELLNRHHEDVRDRWRNYLICGDNQKLANWTEDEEQTLRDVIASCVESIEELKASNQYDEKYNDKPALELVDWQVVSSMMGHTRSRLQCMTKWKKLADRQAPGTEVDDTLDFENNHWRTKRDKQKYKHMSSVDLLDLLNAIRASHAGREGKIPWQLLGDDEFKAKWPTMTRKIAWKRLRSTIEGNRSMMLQDLVKSLIDVIEDGENIDPVFEDDLPDSEKKRSRMTKKPVLSSEMVDAKDDLDESDMEIHAQIMAKTKRKKLINRMARGDENRDRLEDPESEGDHNRPVVTNGRHSKPDGSEIEIAKSDFGDVATNDDGLLDEASDLNASAHSGGEKSKATSESSPLPDEGEATQSEDDSDVENIPALRLTRETSVDLDMT